MIILKKIIVYLQNNINDMENFQPVRKAKINIREISLQEFIVIEKISMLTADKQGWELFNFVSTESLGSLIIGKN